MSIMNSDVIVIGGGASGMMAAYKAAIGGNSVVLLEKNEKLGKKIYITGKGRCNVTNACDFDTFSAQIVSNNKFMFSSLKSFSNFDLYALLEDNGCRLKIERGERVFPQSDHASDINKAFSKMLCDSGVKLELNTEVKEIIKDGDKFFVKTVKNNKKFIYSAPRVIVCTGGMSYPSTGSTGDGYRFAEYFNIKVNEPLPALVPLTASENDCFKLSGVSLKNVEASFYELSNKDKKICSFFGEMLFTHFGISGPIILSASSLLTKGLSEGKKYVLEIDLKPALSDEKLDERILRDFADVSNMQIDNALSKLIISSLRAPVLKRAGINPDKKVHDITKEERKRLVRAIKHFDFTINGTRGFNEAIITQGGIDVKYINPKTMESKQVSGLYFAGEVLDIDAYTGGFNLQLAFSTGSAAGSGI